jgi:hypothetical protein
MAVAREMNTHRVRVNTIKAAFVCPDRAAFTASMCPAAAPRVRTPKVSTHPLPDRSRRKGPPALGGINTTR